MQHKANELRIIGGKWRGRKLKFAANSQIRPTPNRVRETLFNWLAPIINDAICLDLFAGSGALGFEALSRGAKQVTMVDKSPQVIKTLTDNANTLGTDDIEFMCVEFLPALKNPFHRQFDIVFLDPPFHQNLIAPCANWLAQNSCLTEHAFIYIEAESSLKTLSVPGNWEMYKQKTAGQVTYSLFRLLNTIAEA